MFTRITYMKYVNQHGVVQMAHNTIVEEKKYISTKHCTCIIQNIMKNSPIWFFFL